jgi:hypothetical protein
MSIAAARGSGSAIWSSKMADRPGPRRDRTGHLASHFRCFPAVFPLCSRWIYNHQATGGTARDRAKKCLCMSRQAHASSSCVWSVCACLKVRQSSILGPSTMADRPSYRNESSVHAPFSYITIHTIFGRKSSTTHDCRQKELNSWHLTLARVS